MNKAVHYAKVSTFTTGNIGGEKICLKLKNLRKKLAYKEAFRSLLCGKHFYDKYSKAAS